jgi:hypothetical protein
LHFSVVDYLPYMFAYEFIIESAMPKEVASYWTLIYPFDNYIWSFAICLTVLEIIILMIMELIWFDATGLHSTKYYVYEGNV